MPTPMFPSISIGTSFAPSPMATEIHPLPYFLVSLTTSAFWLGLTRQQMTELAMRPALKNSFSRSLFPMITESEKASITIDLRLVFHISWLIFSRLIEEILFGSCIPSSISRALRIWFCSISLASASYASLVVFSPFFPSCLMLMTI